MYTKTCKHRPNLLRSGLSPYTFVQDGFWKHCVETLKETGVKSTMELASACDKCGRSFLTLESTQKFLQPSEAH